MLQLQCPADAKHKVVVVEQKEREKKKLTNEEVLEMVFEILF